LSHLTAGTSWDSVSALRRVSSKLGSGEVVLWKLMAVARSCQAGGAWIGQGLRELNAMSVATPFAAFPAGAASAGAASDELRRLG
jgi:hypothetical protein